MSKGYHLQFTVSLLPFSGMVEPQAKVKTLVLQKEILSTKHISSSNLQSKGYLMQLVPHVKTAVASQVHHTNQHPADWFTSINLKDAYIHLYMYCPQNVEQVCFSGPDIWCFRSASL